MPQKLNLDRAYIVGHLRKCTLFENCNQQILEEISHHCEFFEAIGKEAIFRQDNPHEGIIILIRGCARNYISHDPGLSDIQWHSRDIYENDFTGEVEFSRFKPTDGRLPNAISI